MADKHPEKGSKGGYAAKTAQQLWKNKCYNGCAISWEGWASLCSLQAGEVHPSQW